MSQVRASTMPAKSCRYLARRINQASDVIFCKLYVVARPQLSICAAILVHACQPCLVRCCQKHVERTNAWFPKDGWGERQGIGIGGGGGGGGGAQGPATLLGSGKMEFPHQSNNGEPTTCYGVSDANMRRDKRNW